MAIRLSGSVSRKVPIKGVEFSSQSFGASLEIEINSADANEVQAQLAQLYNSLNQGIDAQIAAASQPPVVQNKPTPPAPAVQTRNGVSMTNRVAGVMANGSIKGVMATEAQVKCIHAVAKKNGVNLAPILANHNVGDVRELPVRIASQVIDQLKAQNGTEATAQ